MQRLRRLLVARYSVPVPRISMCQEPAQWSLRRNKGGKVRSRWFWRVYLAPCLRTTEIGREGREAAGTRARRAGSEAARDVLVGEQLAGARSLRKEQIINRQSEIENRKSFDV